jgi:drug/metabolite transporter (DMT)-like permease
MLALCTAIISGFAIPVNKIFVVETDPAVFTAVRALIIGFIFLCLSSWERRRSGLSVVSRKVGNFPVKSWKYLIAIGVIGGGLAFLAYFTGLTFTTAGRAAFLHKTLPLFAAALAVVFLKEKVGRKQWYALLVMLIGTIILYLAQIPPAVFWMNPGLGDLLVIAAAALWAVESTMAKKAMISGESNFVVSCARMLIGAIVLFAAVLLLGRVDALLALNAHQLANLLISTALLFGYVLTWYWAIKLINVSKASMLLLLAPVVSLAAGAAWLGEPAPILQILGSALILAGAAVAVRIRSEFASGI